MYGMPTNQEEDVLKKYGRDITNEVKTRKTDPVIGRDDEIRSITRILSRKTKNNPVLIGEPGVGQNCYCRRTCPENCQRRCPRKFER